MDECVYQPKYKWHRNELDENDPPCAAFLLGTKHVTLVAAMIMGPLSPQLSLTSEPDLVSARPFFGKF
jgi:hypothetical protein